MSIRQESGSLETLKEQIETARDRMQRLWAETGHANAQVLVASAELDRLINEYQRMAGKIQFGI
jgi:multidrug resistance efflux pump